MTLTLGTVIAASLLAAVSDVRTRRIPNALVIAVLICGLLQNALAGWHAVLLDFVILAGVLAVGTIAFSFKLIGGGDVKLLAVAAGALGYPAGPGFLLYTMLCGGLLAVAFAAAHGRLRAMVTNIAGIALPLAAGAAPARPQNGIAMPYALAILAGALCTAGINIFAPHLRLLP